MRAGKLMGVATAFVLVAATTAAQATARMKPVAVATPNTELVNESVVTVTGKGFVPSSQLFLVECAKGIKGKTASTGVGYCDAAHFQMITATVAGEIPEGTTFTVLTGAIGSLGKECGTSKKTKVCYIGVGDAEASKNNSALAKLKFAAP